MLLHFFYSHLVPSSSELQNFLILWNVKHDLRFATAFCCNLFISTQRFAVFLIVEVLTFIYVMTKGIGGIWKFFMLLVFSCLYPFWRIFFPRKFFYPWLSNSWYPSNIVANIVKSSNDSTNSTLFPLVQNFSISANKQFEFLKQSDLFWKLFSMCWKYSLLPF